MKQKMKVILFALGALCLFALLISYLAMETKINFEEEVELSSGQIIVAERSFRALPLKEIGGPGGWKPTYASFQVRPSSGASYPPKWESDRGLVPILFDVDKATNEWIMVTTFFMCEQWYELGRPMLPYAEYRFRSGAWRMVRLSPELVGRKSNLFAGMKYSGEASFLTRDEKARRDANIKIAKEYLSIVAKWSTSC